MKDPGRCLPNQSQSSAADFNKNLPSQFTNILLKTALISIGKRFRVRAGQGIST
jgi:hypothetical protein